MSGTEAIAVLGVISSIIAIIDGTKQVCSAAMDAQGLPESFRNIATRLPIVQNILNSAKQYIEDTGADQDSWKGAIEVLEACREKANKLDELFQKVIPTDDAHRLEKYISAVKTVGKGGRVESLMKGMLEDVRLLAINHTMISVRTEVAKVIEEVAALPPSIPTHPIQDGQGEDVTQACMASLFLTDPKDDREKLIQLKGIRVDGTCEWIKTNTLYNSWLHSHSQLLWLSGGPGKGKTMLSIYLAEELEKTAKLSEDTLFLQYFCDNKDEKRNTAITIVRGLIYQLLQSLPKLFDCILPSFRVQNASLFGKSSFETLWRIFETMIRESGLATIYCVLDGLDECDDASLENLLRKFATLLSVKSSESPACCLNLIIVSRDLPDFIPEVLSSFPRVRLDPDADAEVNDDIHRFINTSVDELSKIKKYPEPLRVYVKRVFEERSQGTFLWVGIVAQALRNYTATEVEKELNQIPSGLKGLYDRILLQIDNSRRETAARILRWVVMAVRPLTISELGIAIETTVTPSVVGIRCDEATRDKVSHCGHFLVIEDDKVGLIHQSAKDYLLRETADLNPELEFFRVKKDVGNLEIARKCFYYLQNGALADGHVNFWSDIQHLEAFPLLSYAALHWPEHARFLDRSEDIFDLSLSFYQKNSQIRENWLRTYWSWKMGFYEPIPNILHLASYFGMLPLTQNILFKKGWINKAKHKFRREVGAKDDNGQTALHWAAVMGQLTTVQILLENGADIKAKDNSGQTALHWAAVMGQLTTVQILLENGADIKAKDNSGETALHQAAFIGQLATVQILLEKGADLKAKDNTGRTALHQVASIGQLAIVQILLEKGADPEVKNNTGRTALHQAALMGQLAIVQILLEKGADPEVKDNTGRTALHQAALMDQLAIVQILLEKGADPEVKDNTGRTALHQAALMDQFAIVQILLEKGADLKAKDNTGRTALHQVASIGQLAIVQILLEKGADPEVKNNTGRTALHQAALMGQLAIVQILLKKGADPEVKDNTGRTAALLAQEQINKGGATDRTDYKYILRMLQDKESDVKVKGGA